MTKVHDNATDLITFARSSSGTALRRVGYGDELVTNGGFATDSDWTKGTGWTISGGVATLDGSQVSGADFGQILTLKANAVYQVSLDVTNVTTALELVTITGTGGPELQNLSDTGTYTAVFVAPSTSEQLIIRGTSSSVATIDNISVREVIFDRATDPLVLFNHPDDIPRIEYGSDGSLKGLLIEEQRTNLIVDSNDPTTANWATKTTNATQDLTGPDGVVNSAWTLEDDNAAGYEFNETVVGIDAGAATYYATVFVLKDADTSRVAEFQLSATGGASKFHYVQINTSTGETANKNVSGGSTISVDDFGDWWRIGFDITNSGGNTSLAFKVLSAGGASLGSSSNASTGSIGIYGAQLEEGSFATSYIPTSGSQKTRSADVASIPVSAFGYNQDAGTVVVEAKTNNPASSLPHLWQLDANVSNTRIACTFRSSGGAVRMFIQNGGSTDASLYRGTVLTDTAEVTTAGSWQADDIAFSYDGSAVVADTNGCAIPSVSTLRIGSTNVIGTTALNGHIKSLKYYPRRLTDAQLQELTS